MQNLTITAKDKKHSHQLEPKSMAIYQQCRIIEATNELDQTCYIFFYKDHYLNYVTEKKTTKTHSYVVDSFKKGITLPPSHPLFMTVVSSHPNIKKQNFSDLFKKLQKQYTLQETALIASYFESFIKKAQLANFIQSLFYKERRDGKLLSCYRILRIMKDFAPKRSLVDAFSRDMDFTKYEDLYKQGDASLLDKDPIYMENKLYANQHNNQDFQALCKFYQAQDRLEDVIAVHITHVIYTQETSDYDALKFLIEEHLGGENMLPVLEDLYRRGLTIMSLQQDLLAAYMAHERLEDVLTLISKHELHLQPAQSKQLTRVVKQRGITTDSIPNEGLQELIRTLFAAKDNQATEILHQAIASLLNDHNLSYIQEWAQPFRAITLAEPTLQKIDEMNRIAEDPNQQRKLGELYHEFHHPKLAIECMSFDMELREDDPKPVQWLAKLYHELGMNAEYKAYQQLYVDMVKRG
ncbi:hypothetical protein CFK37_10190 [Virgibacillus phasianinus]|uniref:Uncharacterized protein n=1 Tax=Virgibacillus phasianinus TaxID=2017483 RepID=A0A220U314_9BACI|nr:hypothetical protein [Virgibacillus phasianinus]ASK62490.1 hypothetical protein CFK37_10190 [Virgibacillus phasianinus]